MKVLIYHSFNVNNMDTIGRITILYTVDSHNYKAFLIVLAAGVIPDPIIPPNLFRSNSFTSAYFGGLADMVRLLIKYGVNIRACNPEGRTALYTAIIKGYVKCAKILFNYGTNLNEASINGRIPLMMKYYGLQNFGLLGIIIAEYADADTILILASSYYLLKLLGLDGSVIFI
ncbi:uncharacterized protein PgNI_02224 [Pyricularia grisea]|uniref:Ankyrin repeat protein n=1 Tax=Pyricularia grisea TaxID=148305 RepID=A0A6P8BH68_PYRGI|nr:uncharacterized protein PgNI_02224 [Pyricularia grisea]TLD16055.1 hypothetical protein PgNI_02224 [Pyricularia grisea]